MPLEESLTEVNCPITGARFRIVSKKVPTNIKLFIDWCSDVIYRANLGKKINISIDCEGYFLGSIKNSLSCIQIGEIFNDSFDVRRDIHCPNIGNKSGFIIVKPFSKKIREYLSNVLNHPNVMIYTFDFIGDFSTMIEAGINLHMKNVFDSQVATQVYNSNYIQNKSGRSLSWFVEEAESLDPLGPKAVTMKNQDKRNYFCVTSFLFKESKDPTSEVLTKELLEMGAADVYMTGLAAVYCIENDLTQKVLELTNSKVYQFMITAQYYYSYLAPSIFRHLFFIDTYSAYKYDNNLSLKDDTEL